MKTSLYDIIVKGLITLSMIIFTITSMVTCSAIDDINEYKEKYETQVQLQEQSDYVKDFQIDKLNKKIKVLESKVK